MLFQVLEGLETLINLEKLYAGKNKITEISGTHTLTHLTTLSLQVRPFHQGHSSLLPHFHASVNLSNFILGGTLPFSLRFLHFCEKWKSFSIVWSKKIRWCNCFSFLAPLPAFFFHESDMFSLLGRNSWFRPKLSLYVKVMFHDILCSIELFKCVFSSSVHEVPSAI